MLKASQARWTCSLELLFTTSNCETVASSQTDSKIGLHHRTDNQNLGSKWDGVYATSIYRQRTRLPQNAAMQAMLHV